MDQPLDRRSSDGPSDADVIARVLDGHKQEFEHLVGRYQRALYRHAVALVLDHDVAADMVQDAFVRAYLGLRECRDRSRFKPWLFRTLRKLRAALSEAFVMHYVDGVPYETMAELLDASVSALKMRALRAREALGAALKDGNVTGETPVSSIYQTR